MGDINEVDLEAQLLEDARKRAAVTPLPGSLSAAFMPDAIRCGEKLWVRRVKASDWPILQQLESPIIKQMLEFQKDPEIREEIPFEDSEAWEMCWQFTHDPKASRELLAKGRNVYRQTAFEEMGDQLDIVEANNVVKAIGKQIFQSFSTSIKYSAKDEAAEKKTA